MNERYILKQSTEQLKDAVAVNSTDLLDHCGLVDQARRWLKRQGCKVVICELACDSYSNEIPDAIGWQGKKSILIECKTSRSDFLADKRKRFRKNPEIGMGYERYYLAPEGLIKTHDLPDGWGLLEQKGKRVFLKCRNTKTHPAHIQSERALLLSALRRGILV